MRESHEDRQALGRDLIARRLGAPIGHATDAITFTELERRHLKRIRYAEPRPGDRRGGRGRIDSPRTGTWAAAKLQQLRDAA